MLIKGQSKRAMAWETVAAVQEKAGVALVYVSARPEVNGGHVMCVFPHMCIDKRTHIHA